MKLTSSILLSLAFAARSAAGQDCSLPHLGAPVRISSPAHSLARVSLGVLTADFDGDGHSDVAAIDTPGGVVAVLFGDGQGGFSERAFPSAASSLRVADLDGDGRADLVIGSPGQVQIVFVQRDRTLSAGPATLIPSDISGRPGVGDFDGDGRLDLAMSANQNGATWTLALFFGIGGGRFGAPVYVDLPPTYYGTPDEVADFDGDGRAEIAVIAWHRHSSSLLRWNGHGLDLLASFDGGQETYATAVADVNGDGLPDLLLVGTSYVGGAVELYLGDHVRGLISSPFRFPNPLGPGADVVAVGDFDANGTTDIAVPVSLGFRVFLGDGQGAFFTSRDLATSYWAGRLLALPGDGVSAASLVMQRTDGAVDLWPNGCPSADLMLPSLVALSGVSGTRFESQLTVVNKGSEPLALALTYTAAIGSGSGTGSVILLPGQKSFASAFDFLRTAGIPVPAGEDALGTLSVRVTAGAPTSLAALVRTTSTVPGAPGRGGVAYEGVPNSRTAATAAWIPWLREDDHDRTNIAVAHAGGAADGPLTVRLTVHSADPAHPGVAALPDVTLAPGGFYQWNRVLALSGLDAERGYARIERVGGSARFVAYGIVNDNGTGDGSYVAAVPQEDLALARGALLIPAVVENARYVTEVVVTNTSGSPQRLRGRWTVGSASIDVTLDVAAGSQVDIPEFVQWLRDTGALGVPARGTDLAGALVLTPESGDVTGLLAGGRTNTASDTARYGVFTPATAESAMAVYTAWLFGLRQDSEVRTNLALLNLSPVEASFSVSLSTPTGSKTANDIIVAPGAWLQLQSVIADLAPEQTSAFARVSVTSAACCGPANPFMVYAVINDGAEPGKGTGDGSYVPMQTW
jgi:hypothetical protein